MYGEYFDFAPTHKLWIYGNHRPEIRSTDDGIWRRIHLVPFTVTIADAQKDNELPNKLKAELPGILAWAVRGCLDWQNDGLGVPSAVHDATGGYRLEMDVLGRFLDECCYVGQTATATKGELHDEYVAWGDDLGKRMFGAAIRERGFKDGHGTGNVAVWKGVGLLSGRTRVK